jgi:hypothetical protein
MAAPRQLISDFALENPYYAGATVTVFTVDVNLAPTATLATLYENPTGGTTLVNPQVLDGRGKFEQPVYAGEPVSLSVLTAADAPVPLVLGVQGLVARWRGTWATSILYFPGERVRHPTLAGTTYIVAEAHVAGTFVTDVAAGRLVEEISWEKNDETFIVKASPKDSLTVGTAIEDWHMPFAMNNLSVVAGLSAVSTSGAVEVNIKKNGTTIFTTNLTIDANEQISTTAAVPAVLSATSIAQWDYMTVDCVAAGTGAGGLTIYLSGRRI